MSNYILNYTKLGSEGFAGGTEDGEQAVGHGEGRKHLPSPVAGLLGTRLTHLTERLCRTHRGLTDPSRRRSRDECICAQGASSGCHAEECVCLRAPEKDL